MFDLIARADAKAQGLSRYYTGETCPAGHVEQRLVSSRACCGCTRVRDLDRKAKRAIATPDRLEREREQSRARNAVYRSRNRDRVNAGKVEKRRGRIELALAKEAGKRAMARDHLRSYHAAYRETHRETINATSRRHRAANPEGIKVAAHNNRAKRKLAEGKHSAADIKNIRALQRDRCAYCRLDLKKRGAVDHIVALAAGGSNWPNNLQLLCKSCNSRKHTKHPIEFARSLGRLL